MGEIGYTTVLFFCSIALKYFLFVKFYFAYEGSCFVIYYIFWKIGDLWGMIINIIIDKWSIIFVTSKYTSCNNLITFNNENKML